MNRAHVVNGVTGEAMSGEATATVRVVPDPTFDCTDVTGKVFDDANRNGVQDDGEAGLPGVRVVTVRGLQATTDPFGRYHITCAITPHESRGSNFVLKLDDRTLPSGFRMSTDPLQIKRATRGKALQVDFGVSIHRVVSIDFADAVFEPGTTEIRVQWRPRLDLLLGELCKASLFLDVMIAGPAVQAAVPETPVGTNTSQQTMNAGETTAFRIRNQVRLQFNTTSKLSLNLDVDVDRIGSKSIAIDFDCSESCELNMTCRESAAELGLQNSNTVQARNQGR